jgi:hypothetical protein
LLHDHQWPGGGTVKHLYLQIGKDTVIIWPADEEHIRSLGVTLIALADSLKSGWVAGKTSNTGKAGTI